MNVLKVAVGVLTVALLLAASVPAKGQHQQSGSISIIEWGVGTFGEPLSSGPRGTNLAVAFFVSNTGTAPVNVKLWTTFLPAGETQPFVMNTGNESCKNGAVVPLEVEVGPGGAPYGYQFVGQWVVPQQACAPTPIVNDGPGVVTFYAEQIGQNGKPVSVVTQTATFTITP